MGKVICLLLLKKQNIPEECRQSSVEIFWGKYDKLCNKTISQEKIIQKSLLFNIKRQRINTINYTIIHNNERITLNKSLLYFGIQLSDLNETSLKKIFHKLSRENHPDIGGSIEKQQEINLYFTFLNEFLKKRRIK